MQHEPATDAENGLVALFAANFKRLLNEWHIDTFEFGALLLATVLLLCPLFRLGAWLAEQRFAAQRRAALDVRLDETDPEDDNDDHEAEAKEDGALQGADLEGERV
tara:strand:- start:1119 stop:1436 length:318 start_codon:yes stop_codon:yes gene_type:complete